MRLYLDASAIIYAVESVAPFRDRVIARIAQAGGTGELVTSQLSRLECRVKPLREGNTTVLQRFDDFDDFFTRRGLMVADLSAAIIDRATELRARSGGEHGLRFVLPTGPDGVVPWGPMRQALRDRLARRDIARDPRSGRLQLLSDVVRAQIRSTVEDEDGPTVLVDDLKLSWADFGRLFESYEGWHLRVEITDLDDALGSYSGAEGSRTPDL